MAADKDFCACSDCENYVEDPDDRICSDCDAAGCADDGSNCIREYESALEWTGPATEDTDDTLNGEVDDRHAHDT